MTVLLVGFELGIQGAIEQLSSEVDDRIMKHSAG